MIHSMIYYIYFANVTMCYHWITRPLRAFPHLENSTKGQAHGGSSIIFYLYMNEIFIIQGRW